MSVANAIHCGLIANFIYVTTYILSLTTLYIPIIIVNQKYVDTTITISL